MMTYRVEIPQALKALFGKIFLSQLGTDHICCSAKLRTRKPHLMNVSLILYYIHIYIYIYITNVLVYV